MNQEHHNKEIVGNNQGINQDINQEILGRKPKSAYFDAQNMRLSDAEGDKGVLTKIKGETIAYPKTQPTGVYTCIGTSSILDHLIEFWVENTASDDPIITIDGVIVGKSPDMPWLLAYPLQTDKNETCKGGEIFITDFNTPPMIFNIKDILDNSLTQKYFTEFNPKLYSVNLDAPLDMPVFTELVAVGGGGGLPVGSYQYSLRYSNDSGDKTNWGPLTPPIPVVQNLSTASNQYPGVRTYGSDTNNSSPTAYGPKIRFRVTNLADYEYVEIRRLPYNIDAGVDYVPSGLIVAKIPISEQEISIREYIDPSDSNVEIALTDSDETNIMNYIEKAKAIRYHDKRLVLMNIETPDRDSQPTLKDINGKYIFPVVKALGKQGHNDPHSHTYYKNYMSGEKNSFGVSFYDSSGGKGFVFSDPSLANIQAPNRRNPASTESQNYSYEGMVKAADTTCNNVGPTFEVFDLEDAVAKDDVCSFKNILSAGSKTLHVDDYCATPAVSKNAADIGYKPFTPVNQNDSDVTGHNFKPNVTVGIAATDIYNPIGFGPNYFSRGYALGGVENIPSWAKSFSVVKSKRADRVVCQGIGTYFMPDIPSIDVNNKINNKFWFHSPDIEGGLIPQEIIDNINSSSSSYKVQLISPLGFFSEVYNYNERTTNPDNLIDMITYARVLHDEGQINVGEDAGMGISDGSGDRFVSFNKYRNTADTAGGGHFSNDGDTLFGLTALNSMSNGRGEGYYEMETTESIYLNSTKGSDFSNNKQFTEPFYIVNIIQVGKEVRDLNINQYRSTGHYQKVESIIGVGDNAADQSLLLVDERWEDCIPDLTSGGTFASGEVFVYLEDNLGIQKAYMNSTYLSAPAQVLIEADITTNGFWVSSNGTNVFGLYTHTNIGNKEFTLKFDQGYNPTEDDRIIVKYDTRLPISFYGGDTTVSETIYSPIDKEVTDVNDEEQQFYIATGFPFLYWKMNPRYYIVKNTTSVNKVQDQENLSLSYARQMCIMYASENRIGLEYSYGLTYPYQHFPQTNYVMRPIDYRDNEFGTLDPSTIASDNNLWLNYFDDYPEEWLNWNFGGFRTLQKKNLDYAVKGPIEYFGKPQVGFTEENKFCTRITWSLPRQVNVQDSPSLKTFPSNNIFDIEDKSGRIVFAWDAMSGQTGENLYAVTRGGICLLLTKKSILSNLSADDLAIMASDSFISGEYWISNNVGSPGELWRGISDAHIELQTDSGGVIKKPALFLINKESGFRLLDNQVSDIFSDSYKKTLRPVLGALADDYTDKISSVFNRLNNENWIQINDKVFIYDQNFSKPIGRFTYNFDKYTFHKNAVYGHRDLTTYLLNSGYQISGAPIEAFLVNTTAMPSQPMEKEFISLNISTGKRDTMKPTEVQFLDEDTYATMCKLSQANNGPLYLKQYDGWWQNIPRKDASYDPSRKRVQGRILFYKIIHTFEEDFKIINTVVQSKIIK